jgi:hypothetical protein
MVGRKPQPGAVRASTNLSLGWIDVSALDLGMKKEGGRAKARHRVIAGIGKSRFLPSVGMTILKERSLGWIDVSALES